MGLIKRIKNRRAKNDARRSSDQDWANSVSFEEAKADFESRGKTLNEQQFADLQKHGNYRSNGKPVDGVPTGIGAKAFGRMDPFGGRMLGLDGEDRAKMNANPQWYGGSQQNFESYQDKYGRGASGGGAIMQSGLADARLAAQGAATANSGVAGNFGLLANQQSQLAAQANGGFNQSAGNYNSARNMVLGSANELAQNARNAPGQFMQTDRAQFQAQQDANQKAALALGATGGAAGLRSALATSADANSAASQNANITRANQYNQLLGLQQSGLSSAASLQSGVAAQDQGMAGLQANRQAGAVGQQANAYAQQGNLNNTSGQLGIQAANIQTGAGLTTQGQYLGAEQGANTSQLASSQAFDALRQQDAKREYDNTWRPMKKIFGG